MELVGPAGVGKTTLAQKLHRVDARVHVGLSVWGLPRARLIRGALGLVNGYFIAGSIWYYMHQAQYPLPYVQPLPDATVTANYMKYMPPMLLGIPNIYFAIIAAFVFVIIVFI